MKRRSLYIAKVRDEGHARMKDGSKRRILLLMLVLVLVLERRKNH